MSSETNRLGKGLSALISNEAMRNNPAYNETFPIEKIVPNPYQPRMNINPEELIELADSIREHGVIQPLIITKDTSNEGQYYLIAGERRLRACQLAGLATVPVVIKEISPQEMLELALIENIQRKDLNPLEEGIAFKQLQDEFGLTHELIAKKVGISRVAVTNKIRLLGLPEVIKEYVLNGQLSEGHARALLGLSDEMSAMATASIVVKKQLSVRETEDIVRKINFGKETSKKKIELMTRAERELVEKLSKKIGYSANVVKLNSGGKIVIRYQDENELKDIVGKLVDRG